MNRTAATIIINALLIATALLKVIPLLWMVSGSFMPTGEATIFPPRLLPSHATITHHRDLFTHMNFGRTFANSMIVAIAISCTKRRESTAPARCSSSATSRCRC